MKKLHVHFLVLALCGSVPLYAGNNPVEKETLEHKKENREPSWEDFEKEFKRFEEERDAKKQRERLSEVAVLAAFTAVIAVFTFIAIKTHQNTEVIMGELGALREEAHNVRLDLNKEFDHLLELLKIVILKLEGKSEQDIAEHLKKDPFFTRKYFSLDNSKG